jgi:hypothetical protein
VFYFCHFIELYHFSPRYLSIRSFTNYIKIINIQDWEDIQYLLGKHGSDNIQKRVVTRRPEDIDIDIADDADSLIQPYSIDKCRDVSNGICSFYKWVNENK